MIKLGTSHHPKSDREMYEDYFIFFPNQLSKAHIKLLKKQSTNTQQSLNDPPTKPLYKFPTNLQQSSF